MIGDKMFSRDFRVSGVDRPEMRRGLRVIDSPSTLQSQNVWDRITIMSDITIVSAPGKVLLTGGYLVLDPAYSGLVIATSSRFYSIVRTRPATAASSGPTPHITVNSPQFDEAVWNYTVECGDNSQIKVQPVGTDNGRNKFVEIALQKTLSLIEAMDGQMKPTEVFDGSSLLEIVIAGDNDFYSQRRAVSSPSLVSLHID